MKPYLRFAEFTFREHWDLGWCIWQAIFSKTPTVNPHIKRRVFLIPGIFNEERALIPLQNYLNRKEGGCKILSTCHFSGVQDTLLHIQEQITESVEEDESVYILGYSLGGLVGIQLLFSPLGRNIKKVVALGTPVHGSPLEVASNFVETGTGVSGETFKQLVEEHEEEHVKRAFSKLVLLGSEFDMAAPPESFYIDNARHVNLTQVLHGERIGHLGLIRYEKVWEIVEKELV